MQASNYKVLLFGAAGAIGKAMHEACNAQGWIVIPTTRTADVSMAGSDTYVTVDPFDKAFDPSCLDGHGPFAAVIWAQGANLNDSIYDVDLERHMEVYGANCLFVIATLKWLLDRRLLARPSRLVVISSIWQRLARQSKLSYCVSKAALQGLVLSAAADLAKDGHLINAILPGALDTPMTRRSLAPDQLATLKRATYFDRLPTLDDVANTAVFLCSERNTGLTGQFLEADLGFSHVRII